MALKLTFIRFSFKVPSPQCRFQSSTGIFGGQSREDALKSSYECQELNPVLVQEFNPLTIVA